MTSTIICMFDVLLSDLTWLSAIFSLLFLIGAIVPHTCSSLLDGQCGGSSATLEREMPCEILQQIPIICHHGLLILVLVSGLDPLQPLAVAVLVKDWLPKNWGLPQASPRRGNSSNWNQSLQYSPYLLGLCLVMKLRQQYSGQGN